MAQYNSKSELESKTYLWVRYSADNKKEDE